MQVVALIEEDDGNFGVWFPDFPGCVTGADSLDEAVAKAAEVLAFHVEGLTEDGPLPVPRTLAALRKDPEFRAEAKRALPVLVPYAPPSRAVRLNITLDQSLLVRIDHAAEAAGETRSRYLAEAARRRLACAPRWRRPASTSSTKIHRDCGLRRGNRPSQTEHQTM